MQKQHSGQVLCLVPVVTLSTRSDVSYGEVMELAARVRAAGAAFELLPWHSGMLRSIKPVVAVTATRTGCGKSQVGQLGNEYSSYEAIV